MHWNLFSVPKPFKLSMQHNERKSIFCSRISFCILCALKEKQSVTLTLLTFLSFVVFPISGFHHNRKWLLMKYITNRFWLIIHNQHISRIFVFSLSYKVKIFWLTINDVILTDLFILSAFNPREIYIYIYRYWFGSIFLSPILLINIDLNRVLMK